MYVVFTQDYHDCDGYNRPTTSLLGYNGKTGEQLFHRQLTQQQIDAGIGKFWGNNYFWVGRAISDDFNFVTFDDMILNSPAIIGDPLPV